MQNITRTIIGITLVISLSAAGIVTLAPASASADGDTTLSAGARPSGTGGGAARRPATPHRPARPAAELAEPAPEPAAGEALPATPAPRQAPGERVLAVDQNGSKSAADPSLEREGDRWLLFTTQAYWSNVPVWESTDMVDWAFVRDALPALPEWARPGKTWAPDAVEIGGRWVLFFSALWGETELHCIGHTVADSANGPYEPFEDPIVCPLADGGAIDPMVHVAADGMAHLLWKVDANAVGGDSVLVSQPLVADGTALTGEPSEILRYDGGWEWPLIEQPELISIDGELHLFYAAGWYNTADYQVGHAVCESVAGPCERTTTGGGWLTTVDGIAGPGALSIAEADGGLVGVYHAWIDEIDEHNDFRSLVVEPIEVADGRPV